MSLPGWPDGWRFPGRFPGRVPRHHVNPPRPRPPAPLPPEAVYGGAADGRRTCSDGHDVVIWHGPDVCFVCAGPGRDAVAEGG